jgi:hypothetical protein
MTLQWLVFLLTLHSLTTEDWKNIERWTDLNKLTNPDDSIILYAPTVEEIFMTENQLPNH